MRRRDIVSVELAETEVIFLILCMLFEYKEANLECEIASVSNYWVNIGVNRNIMSKEFLKSNKM